MPIEPKLHPRNRPAWDLQRRSGNPVTTLLESGVGNCFPGLEFDIRNLERRFFPFMAVDLIGQSAIVVEINITAARASASLSPQQLSVYEQLARDIANPARPLWLIREITANFGPFGDMTLNLSTTGQQGRPDDAWTAVRLIPDKSPITLRLSRDGEATANTTLQGERQVYLAQDGAHSSIFRTGEMTQSLCSPWTHDFRDCGCYYWASNHPDIVQVQKPVDAPPSFAGDRMVAWQRSIKGSFSNPPAPASANQVPAE